MAPADRNDAATAATIEIAQPRQSNTLSVMLQRVAASSGRPLGALLRDFLKTSFGAGKLNFDEFIALGLYDPSRYAGAELRNFVGLGAMQRIWRQANFRGEFEGLVGNKIAMAALLQAYGFPVIPIAAVASMVAGYPGERTLRSAEAIKAFLADPAHYPLFGKPVAGSRSLGSVSLQGYDPTDMSLIGHDGTRKPLDRFVEDIVTHFGDGYVFQPRMLPHVDTRAICGERLATVRVLTTFTREGPKILRACEKIPADLNIADNYWHKGNLLAQLDRQTGMRGRVVSGTGFDMREHSHHPDSGALITGTFVPNWPILCDVALEAARLVRETALIGWDIAPVDSGVVIVEANATPDLLLPQLADHKGILDTDFLGFLEERKQLEQAWKQELRAFGRQQHRTSFMN